MEFFKKLFGGDNTDYKGLVSNGALIVDVRSAGEYSGGHIQGSINIPVDTIQSKMAELKKKGKPVITVCLSGARSGMAQNALTAAGIEAYNGGPWLSLEKKLV
jgi:phage shock protein E